MRNTILGVLFLLFLVCFGAIIVEELFLGGRRKRRLLKESRARRAEAPGRSIDHEEGSGNAHHTSDRA